VHRPQEPLGFQNTVQQKIEIRNEYNSRNDCLFAAADRGSFLANCFE